MLDLVEGEIERREFGECLEAFDMRDEVVVQINLGQSCGGIRGDLDGLYAVLA